MAQPLGTRQAQPHLPVLPALGELLPSSGLRYGSVVTVTDAALLLALTAGPAVAGGWVAVVGMPECGVLAATEMGVAPERLLLVDNPGSRWVEVVAALLDAVELVAIRPTDSPPPAVARRLVALARNRKAALAVAGSWPGADLDLGVTSARWVGLHPGHGRLRSRYVDVTVTGRGSAGQPRRGRLWLPAADGVVRTAPRPIHDAVPIEDLPAIEQAIA